MNTEVVDPLFALLCWFVSRYSSQWNECYFANPFFPSLFFAYLLNPRIPIFLHLFVLFSFYFVFVMFLFLLVFSIYFDLSAAILFFLFFFLLVLFSYFIIFLLLLLLLLFLLLVVLFLLLLLLLLLPMIVLLLLHGIASSPGQLRLLILYTIAIDVILLFIYLFSVVFFSEYLPILSRCILYFVAKGKFSSRI